jgi:hypothetical protein
MERLRIPVVGPVRLGRQQLRVCIGYAREFEGAAGLRLDSAGPRDPCNERRGGEELAGLTVKHVEEAVLVRLKHDPARLTFERQIGLDERLRGVVIEGSVAS